ncbi:MAG: hypothetical protein AB7S26_10505 [Sandaracinaceae bacterium]
MGMRRSLTLGLASLLALSGCGSSCASDATGGPPAPPSRPTPAPTVPLDPAPLPATPPAVLAEAEVIEWPAGRIVALDTLVPSLFTEELCTYITQPGAPLIAIYEDRIVVVPADGASPTRAYSNELGCGDARALTLASGALVTMNDHDLVARELDTLAIRWRRHIDPGEPVGSGDTVVVTTFGAWLGLDAASGETRWEHRRGARAEGVLLGDVLVATVRNAVIGIAVSDGAERFRLAVERPALLRAGERTAAAFVIQNDEREIDWRTPTLVSADGTSRRLDLDAELASFRSLLVDERGVYAMVEVAPDRVELRRYDQAGEVVARSRPFDVWLETPSLVAMGSELAIFGAPSGLRILDASTLADRWVEFEPTSAWLGPPTVWQPSPERAPVLVEIGLRWQLLLHLAGSAGAPRPVRVSGTLRCDGQPVPDTELVVEDVVTRTDERGRYRARATVGAAVHVDAVLRGEAGPGGDCRGTRSADIDRRARTAEVDLDMSTPDPVSEPPTP